MGTELVWLKQIFDAQADHIAVLDVGGKIIAVNKAWKQFARDNGARDSQAYLGSNYLTICNATWDQDADIAKACYRGLKEILAGKRSDFSLEYPCHSPTEQRWFLLKARPLEQGAVVIHTDITQLERKRQGTLKLQEVLLEATKELLTQEVTPQFYQRLLERAVALIPGAQAGSVTVRGEDNRFHFVAAVGFDLAGLSEISFDENELFYADQGLSASKSYLVHGVDTINLKTLDAKRLRQLRKAGHAQRIKVTLGVPIYIANQVSATLSFDNLEDEHAFDEDARQIAEALGTQVGLILQNLREKEFLKKSESLFSTLFHQNPTPVLLTTIPEFRVTDANQSYLEMVGFKAEEVIGKEFFKLPIAIDPRSRAGAERLARGEAVPLEEIQLRTKSGRVCTALRHAIPITVNGQRLALVTVVDITEQVQSREALRQSEALFSTLFHQSPAPTFLSSLRSNQVLDANRSFLELVGYSHDEVIGQEVLKLPFLIDERVPSDSKALRESRAVLKAERTIRTKSGTLRTTLGSSVPVVVEGEPCVLTTLMDITERKRTEEQLTQAIQEVMQDAEWFSHSVMEKLAQMKLREADKAEATELTEREYQVLALIARGKDNTEIGKDLGISPQTVRNYVSQIYSKLGIHSRAEAVVWARERGITI